MTSLDVQRKQWTQTFDEVERETLTLFHTRQMWRTLGAVIMARGSAHRGGVMDYLNQTYVASICSAVRRQLDSDRKADSLARWLQRLIDEPRLLDRARFVELHTAVHGDEYDPNVAFDAFAEPDSEIVSVALLLGSLFALREGVEPVIKYADRVIAHPDRRSADLVYGEIDAALAALEVTIKRFWGLAHPGVMLHSPTPIMELGFLTIFREPLIDGSFRVPDQH